MTSSIKILSLIVLLNGLLSEAGRTISFTNKCGYNIWISPLTNARGPMLAPGITRVANKQTFTYNIPDNGWAGRFWPKSGCNAAGQNCEVGQSVDPCGPNGCDPPAETKVEFYIPRVGTAEQTWFDISLVDGYSLPVEIVPSSQGGSCIKTNCAVSMQACPRNEKNVGNLQIVKNNKAVYCLSPCKKWNYPPPFGQGKPEKEEPGQHLCCPTPPISAEQCRKGPVVETEYVKLIHRVCPTAYSYAYDDEGGLHNCPNQANFKVTFCP